MISIQKTKREMNPDPDISFDFKNQALVDSFTYPLNPSRDISLPTIYRSSFATYINSDKKIQSVGFHKARLNYDFETGEKLGMLLEPYAKNYAGGVDNYASGGWTYTNISHNSGFHPSPCVDVNKDLATIFKSDNVSSSIRKTISEGDLYLKYVTISAYIKYIGGDATQGYLISISGHTESETRISTSSLIMDGKWHRYSVTFKLPDLSSFEVKLMSNLPVGARLAIFGVQIEEGKLATSLMHHESLERQADDFVLPFSESHSELEGSISLGIIPLVDPETTESLYPIQNAESGSFPELQIGKESQFSLSFVSDTSWLARSPDSGLSNNAVHTNEAGTWTQAIAGATWIWRTFNTIPSEVIIEFTKVIELPEEPTSASIQIAADDDYTVFINGRAVAIRDHAYISPMTHTDGDVLNALKKGTNTILIHVGNNGLFYGGLLCKMDISCKPTTL